MGLLLATPFFLFLNPFPNIKIVSLYISDFFIVYIVIIW